MIFEKVPSIMDACCQLLFKHLKDDDQRCGEGTQCELADY